MAPGAPGCRTGSDDGVAGRVTSEPVVKRLAIAFAAGVLGYMLGAVGGGFLISVLSSNTHDRSVEAAMTGAFVTGPLIALIAFVIVFARAKQR